MKKEESLMKTFRIFTVLMLVGILAAGCSQETDMTAPDSQVGYDKNGTETLGPPSIEIATGTCFAQGGVGMVAPTDGVLEIDVPDGEIKQVLLYWSGGTTGADGDDMIKIDGNDVLGTEIGGPTNFFSASGAEYYFTAFRADITDMGLVTNGANSFVISDFDFDNTGGPLDENHGAGIMVIYDDGTPADIQLVDGLDCAYHGFAGDLRVTVPQTFIFDAHDEDRVAKMVIFSGSVGAGRPNEIHLSTEANPRLNELGSNDGDLWDTLCLEDIPIPAGETSLTVELVSTPTTGDPDGASLTWVGCGFALPTPVDYCIGDYVWYDANRDGCQDPDEMPAEGVEVNLYADCPAGDFLFTTLTDEFGYYDFCELMPGDYTVEFVAPDGFYFCDPFSDDCDDENDSNAGADGMTDCITIVDADNWTIDAALCVPVEEGCTLTIGFWKNHAGLGNGNQDDVLSQYLPIDLGDAGGSKTLAVTDRYIAVDVLEQKTYGRPNNGITKLYAQMLAAKLNFAAGASDGDVADYIADADAFLADHDHDDWGSLTDEEADNVMMWHGAFDDYNNGDIGPGHCDDRDDDDDNDDDVFK
jgi:hypothetical protein